MNNILFDGDWKNEVIERAINNALEYENVEHDCEIEVIVVDKDKIRSLNKETRNIDRVTDVLSYPMFETVSEITPDESGFAFLGSMVICSDRAVEQAEEYGHSVDREAAFLAVHSVLHLLGYDHELGEQEEKEMFSKQEEILTEMGLIR